MALLKRAVALFQPNHLVSGDFDEPKTLDEPKKSRLKLA